MFIFKIDINYIIKYEGYKKLIIIKFKPILKILTKSLKLQLLWYLCLINVDVYIYIYKCFHGMSNICSSFFYNIPAGISPSSSKVTVISNFPILHSMRELHQFLTIINFYHKFLFNCVCILKLMTDILTNIKIVIYFFLSRFSQN